jgi:hypothetical protein
MMRKILIPVPRPNEKQHSSVKEENETRTKPKNRLPKAVKNSNNISSIAPFNKISKRWIKGKL